MNYIWVGSLVVAGAVGFGAGWTIKDNQLKSEQIKTLKSDRAYAENSVKVINGKLQEVVTKTQQAATESQTTLDKLAVINSANTNSLELISTRTQGINNEISKLGIPKCVFSFESSGLWERIGETANTGRRSLYGTEAPPTN